jgi:tetratricopeptide (TPR) repeat protein
MEKLSPMSIFQLRARGCWNEGAVSLANAAKTDPVVALQCAALLTEQFMFTLDGWQEAEEALSCAEALSENPEDVGATASERAFFSYIQTLMGGNNQTERAFSAMELADRHLRADSPFRPLFEFRRGLLAENLKRDTEEARKAYTLAHNAAKMGSDKLLLSYTYRHLGSLAEQEEDFDKAYQNYTLSLRLREEIGFAIGIAPALVTLAQVSTKAEKTKLLAEAKRFVQAFNGIPVWLARSIG